MAAGYTDGFFEKGLQPWDAAAGSLVVTEYRWSGGNFTGEADFLEQQECLAGNPSTANWWALWAKYSKFASAGEKTSVRQAPAAEAEQAPTRTAQARTDPARSSALPATPFKHRRLRGRLLATGVLTQKPLALGSVDRLAAMTDDLKQHTPMMQHYRRATFKPA